MSATHLIEQQSLLGGTDLVPLGGDGRGRQRRAVQVDPRWKLGFAAALALVVEKGRQERKTQLPATTHCPRCGADGLTEADFGTRVLNGVRRPQSWCRRCRSAQRGATQKRPAQAPLALMTLEEGEAGARRGRSGRRRAPAQQAARVAREPSSVSADS